VTFVIILAMRVDFCMIFHRTVKQDNIQLTTKFHWNISDNNTRSLAIAERSRCRMR